MNINNLTEHPCKDKCSRFKDEPCETCLVEDSQDYALGGFVVYKQTESIHNDLANALYEILEIHNDYVVVTGAGYDFLMMWDSEIRHATNAEILNQRRFPQSVTSFGLDMGNDQFIENHISPNCKSVSNDESIFYNRAMNAQREVS